MKADVALVEKTLGNQQKQSHFMRFYSCIRRQINRFKYVIKMIMPKWATILAQASTNTNLALPFYASIMGSFSTAPKEKLAVVN